MRYESRAHEFQKHRQDVAGGIGVAVPIDATREALSRFPKSGRDHGPVSSRVDAWKRRKDRL